MADSQEVHNATKDAQRGIMLRVERLEAETLLWAGAAVVLGGGAILFAAKAFEELFEWGTREIPFAGFIVLSAGLSLAAVGAARKAASGRNRERGS